MSKNLAFKVGERVVYPSHGVGEVVEIEVQIIADTRIAVYVISFPQNKMTLTQFIIIDLILTIGLFFNMTKQD